MDGWMKATIIAACAVIIIGGGHYGWKEYVKTAVAAETQSEEDLARREIFDLAEAESGDLEKVRDFCKATIQLVGGNTQGEQFAQRIARNCKALGYI